MICSSYVFQREFFSTQKNIKQIHQNCVSFCLFTSPFLFYFSPLLGTPTTENQESLFSPVVCKPSWWTSFRLVMKPESKEGFQASAFSLILHMALAQRIALVLQQGWEIHLCKRKKRWKVYGLQCEKSSCRAASLPQLLKPRLVVCCSSHQLCKLNWIAVDHLKCFPCQLSTESCWNGSLLCSSNSLLAMPSWWLSPIPLFF